MKPSAPNDRATRSQSLGTVRDRLSKCQMDSRAGDAQKATKPTAGPSRSRVTKTQRGKRKVIKGLEKKLKAQDPKEALKEYNHLFVDIKATDEDLGLPADDAQRSPATPGRSSRRRRKGKDKKRYMDDEPELSSDDEEDGGLQRWGRWIPNIEHRESVTQRPRGVHRSLWSSYVHLSEYVYRMSRTDSQLRSLPLLGDVHLFQDGKGTSPPVPPGFAFDADRNLVPR